MILSKLDGYNEVSGQYSVGGIDLELPSPAFVVGTSTPVGYSDFGLTPQNWDSYAKDLVGEVVGFKDWLCLRAEIKTLIYNIAGSDFVNWDLLTVEQKIIAIRYVPTKIIDTKGSDFFITQSGGLYQGKAYLDEYQTLAETSRKKRLKTFGDFGYYGLGKDNGLQLERMYQVLALNESYTERGVMYLAEDSIDGIGDWVMGTNGFGANGLKPLLVAGTFNLLAGFPYTIDQFCDILATNILENGQY
jgi:hypothetical protein